MRSSSTFLVADFTNEYVPALVSLGTGYLPTGKVASERGESLMDPDIVTFKSVQPPIKVGIANAIEKAAAGLISDVSSSQLSALHALSASSPEGSEDNYSSLTKLQLFRVNQMPLVLQRWLPRVRCLPKQTSLAVRAPRLWLTNSPQYRRLTGRQSLPFPPRVLPVASSGRTGVQKLVWSVGHRQSRSLKKVVVVEKSFLRQERSE